MPGDCCLEIAVSLPASDLNRLVIAKVLSRGLLKDFSPFQWTSAISPELQFWAGYRADSAGVQDVRLTHATVSLHS